MAKWTQEDDEMLREAVASRPRAKPYRYTWSWPEVDPDPHEPPWPLHGSDRINALMPPENRAPPTIGRAVAR